MDDPRFTVHNATVQRLPSTVPNPKRKLSHTVKAKPSARVTGSFQPIATRVAFLRGKRHAR